MGIMTSILTHSQALSRVQSIVRNLFIYDFERLLFRVNQESPSSWNELLNFEWFINWYFSQLQTWIPRGSVVPLGDKGKMLIIKCYVLVIFSCCFLYFLS